MATANAKTTSLDHVEDTHPHGQQEDIIRQQLQHDAKELEEKYHIPIQAILESHREEDPAAVRKVMRKVDLRLVPMLSVLYMWAFIDRSNLGNVSCVPSKDGESLLSLRHSDHHTRRTSLA